MCVFQKADLWPHFSYHPFKRLRFRLIYYKNQDATVHNHIKLANLPFHHNPNPNFYTKDTDLFFRHLAFC